MPGTMPPANAAGPEHRLRRSPRVAAGARLPDTVLEEGGEGGEQGGLELGRGRLRRADVQHDRPRPARRRDGRPGVGSWRWGGTASVRAPDSPPPAPAGPNAGSGGRGPARPASGPRSGPGVEHRDASAPAVSTAHAMRATVWPARAGITPNSRSTSVVCRRRSLVPATAYAAPPSDVSTATSSVGASMTIAIIATTAATTAPATSGSGPSVIPTAAAGRCPACSPRRPQGPRSPPSTRYPRRPRTRHRARARRPSPRPSPGRHRPGARDELCSEHEADEEPEDRQQQVDALTPYPATAAPITIIMIPTTNDSMRCSRSATRDGQRSGPVVSPLGRSR